MKSLLTRITLILLLISAWAGLTGQQTPIRLGGKNLELPSGWQSSYDPPEVLLRVLVEADSSLYLLQILDGKEELVTLVRAHLKDYKNLLQTEYPGVGVSLDVILGIDQPAPIDATTESANTPLQLIEAWITQQRKDFSFREPLQQPAQNPLFGQPPEPYTAGYFNQTRSEDTNPSSLNGFTQQSSFFGSGLYNQYYHAFHHHTGRDYLNLIYPYAVTLSDIQAGMGDYEHRFARGSLKKNDLFGVKRLYLDFDFLVQSGNWLELNSTLSGLKGFLSVPLGNTDLELEIANYGSNLSHLELRPEYWQPQNFLIEHRYRQIYAAWKNPWLNLALQQFTESAAAEEFYQTLRNSLLRLQAYKSLELGVFGIDALYEHKLSETDTDLTHGTFTDLAKLGIRYSGNRLQASTEASMYDFERFNLAGELNIHFSPVTLSPYAILTVDDTTPQTWVNSLYSSTGKLFRVDIRQKSDFGLRAGYALGDNSQIFVSLGQKNVENYFQVLIPDSPQFRDNLVQEFKTQDVPYLNLGAELSHSWNKWSVSWKPQLTLQSGVDDLYEEPALEYQTHFSLSRDLGYGNALFAGFSVLGHSGYTSADNTAFAVETSALADIWAGFQITNRFEVLVAYKNITDSYLYGVYPLPRSLHASLRWFFLN